jgi:DNA-binding SARP family transcriptional activator
LLDCSPERDLGVPLLVIALRFLGTTDVRAADGSESLAVLKQPKRMALLAYLAAATPHRFHRRDSLLALFWPDLSQSQARSALRRALFYLRRALGPDVISSRGDELGTSPELVWCDVAVFQQVLEANRLPEALELFRGNLLEGLHVPSAPDFERWLDDERRRLRDLAVRAAWALSERAERSGDVRDAARWATRGFELTPDDEPGLRRLVRLLDRSGARAAALKAYDGFVQRLADELDLEPEPETVALLETVRSRRDATVAEASARRPPSPNLIAVLPFVVRGPDRLLYLREGMVDLLAAKLDGAGDLRTVDPRRTLRRLESVGAGDIDAHEARAIGEHLRAGWCLLGSVVATGARLHIAVTLCQAEGEREIKADVGTYGEQEIFKAVDAIARHILAQWSTSYGGEMARLAAVTTESLAALKAYLVGERAFRAGRFSEALTAYEEAVREDPTFALGHYRLAAAYAARGTPRAALEPGTRAWEHRHRLNPRLRLLVEAQAAALRGAAATAENLCRGVTRQMPTNVDAWFLLGETQFRYNPDRGRSTLEARRPFERTLKLDPRHVGALARLIRLAARERRTADLPTLLQRLERAEPDAEQALSARTIGAFALDDTAARSAVIEDLRDDPLGLAAAVADVAIYVRAFAAAEQLAGLLIDIAPSPVLRAHAHLLLAYLALASTHVDRALKEFERVERTDRPTALLHRALVLGQEQVDAPTAVIEDCRRAVEGWQPVAARGASQDAPLVITHDGILDQLHHYVLGLLAARLGDLEAALEHAELCAAEAGADPLPIDLATGVRARVALLRSDADGAVALLDTIAGEYPSQLATGSPFYGRVAERFLRAEALDAAGRSAEAWGWFDSLVQRSPFELMLHRPAEERSRRIRRSRPSLGGGNREA